MGLSSFRMFFLLLSLLSVSVGEFAAECGRGRGINKQEKGF